MSNSLICWSKCKDRLLLRAPIMRAHKFTRVSEDVKDYLEVRVAMEIDKIIRGQPGKGMTISVGTHKRGSSYEQA